MKKRPIYVTIIAWFLIVIGIASMILTPLTYLNPTAQELAKVSHIPLHIRLMINFITAAFYFISGVGLLKAQNWARYLYIITQIIVLVLGVVTVSKQIVMLLPDIILFFVITFFLFRPNANHYFTKSKNKPK